MQDPNKFLLTFNEFLIFVGGCVFLMIVVAWGLRVAKKGDDEEGNDDR